MKVFHTAGIGSMSGKSAQSVFLPSGIQGMSYLRQYTYPRITANNTLRGAEMANIKLCYFSAEALYITDLKTYAQGYANLTVYGEGMTKRANSAFPVFVKLMYAIQALDPTHIDLDSVSLADIDTLLPGKNNIYDQVLAGLLPSIPGVEDLSNPWAL